MRELVSICARTRRHNEDMGRHDKPNRRIKVYSKVLDEGNADLLDELVAGEYIQHNPLSKSFLPTRQVQTGCTEPIFFAKCIGQRGRTLSLASGVMWRLTASGSAKPLSDRHSRDQR